ncbi:hypothetical protein [Pyrobaculum sp.]|uniref:hypothetical protein n=1 Tax=Pyrobaculum sp. TaxID=2004705 RepID=UPI0031773FC4
MLAEVLHWVANSQLVIAAGLNLDFRGEPFETTARLMAHADREVPLTATCKICGRPATRTQRLVEGRPAPRDSLWTLVCGSETYEALSGRHRVAP